MADKYSTAELIALARKDKVALAIGAGLDAHAQTVPHRKEGHGWVHRCVDLCTGEIHRRR